MRVAIVLALGSACAIPDADYNAFTCATSATIPAQITITGTVTNALISKQGVPGITVTPTSDGAAVVTDQTGAFAVELTIDGSAAGVSFDLSGSGFVPTVYVPFAPFTGDTQISAEVIATEELAMIGSATGLPVGSDDGLVFISAVDCMDNAVYGAEITASPGTRLYLGSDFRPDATLTQTIAPTGAAIVVGVTALSTEVAASYGSTPNDNSVATSPGVLTETEIVP